MRRGIISINTELKRKLEMLRGERTWDKLLNTTIKAKVREVENFLRETADKRESHLKTEG
ncbi:MAG: hypothetical protein ACUX7D_00440 [Candidatus Methanodesulfokora washburnensis]|jgi:hypothetical protein